MNRIHLRGQVRELVATDVAQLVGPRLYSSIMANDQQPFFIEMIVAHEGTSRGEIAGLGARVKEWGKRVIRALVSAFDPSGRWPAKLYDGIENWHGNETARVPVGEVVHSRVCELAGVTGAQAIGYVFPAQVALREAIRKGERDCCSIEADVVAVGDASGRIVIEDVERASGIVLGHTSKQMPGFAHATVRALHEFCPPEEEGEKGSKGEGGKKDDPPKKEEPQAKASISKDDLVAAIKESGLKATDIWPEQKPVDPAKPADKPAPVDPIPAPPEKKEEPAATVDLTSPKFNEFLPE